MKTGDDSSKTGPLVEKKQQEEKKMAIAGPK